MILSAPVHPITGVSAIGVGKRGPIWPVMGGSEEAPPPPAPIPDPAPPAPTPPAGDKGFPDGTPLAEMNVEQREAYWKHYARQHEDAAKAYNALGLTPQQVKDLQAEAETLRTEKLSADEKAQKTIRDETYKQAMAEAESRYLPQIQRSDVQNLASTIIQGDRLKAFMDLVSPRREDGGYYPPAALLDADGKVDETKVMGHLTAMYGNPQQQQQPNVPSWQNFGQHTTPPPSRAGASGKAEAEKRFGSKPPK